MSQLCQPDTLKERAIAGDPEVLEEIFHCYRSDLEAFLRQRCGHVADADDAVQDAFEAAARYLQGYRGEASIKTWLYRLASSACTRMRRGRKNDPKRHIAFEDAGATGARAKGSPFDNNSVTVLEDAIDARLSPLQEALRELSATDRAVLILREGEGMTAKEVAVALDLTETAVKSRLYRARKAMKQKLLATFSPDDGSMHA